MAPALEDAPASAPASVDFTGLLTFTRNWEQQFPAAEPPRIDVSHKHGPLNVRVWDQPIVRATATMTVGALDQAVAQKFAEAISVQTESEGPRLLFVSTYPNGDGTPVVGGYTMELSLDVPRASSLSARNDFGDTSVIGINGQLTLDSVFGAVELRNIGGVARVYAKGEFPFVARGLLRGGTFVLRGSAAMFSEYSDTLVVRSTLGSLEVRNAGAASELDVTADFCPVHVYVNEGASPSLYFAAQEGVIESEVELERDAWGTNLLARKLIDTATQRINVHSSFETIYVHQEAAQPVPAPVDNQGAQSVQESIGPLDIPIAADGVLQVQAAIGDVRVLAGDVATVTITAAKHARLGDIAQAPAAMALLGFETGQAEDGAITVTTSVREGMAQLTASDYRVDLQIVCLRTIAVRLKCEEGHTYVSGAVGAVVVEQGRGIIEIIDTKGGLDLSSRLGDVTVVNSGGPVALRATAGTVSLREILADAEVRCAAGNIVVDTPRAGLLAAGQKGDVRVIAAAGIFGDFDIKTEDGSINVLAPEVPNANFHLSTYGGSVHSRLPISGTQVGDVHSYQTEPISDAPRVFLEAKRGNIYLD